MRGSSLLETMAAVALAGLVSAGWADSLAHQARTLSKISDQSESLSLARNLLATAAAAPCAPKIPCPEDKTCRESRHILRKELWADRPLERIEVVVDSPGDPGPPVRLSTIAPFLTVCR
jgi:hypothetical protein